MKVKIAIRYERWIKGEFEVESVWAKWIGPDYELDNIPFYARELALGDIVSAKADADGALQFERLVRPSGHSTIRLLFSNESDVQEVRDELRARGCASELSDVPTLVAVDIPPTVPYSQMKAWLDAGEKAQLFEYEEGCLGQDTRTN